MVLQEQGGRLAAFPASAVEQRKAPCAASMHAYRDLASIARDSGAAVLESQPGLAGDGKAVLVPASTSNRW